MRALAFSLLVVLAPAALHAQGGTLLDCTACHDAGEGRPLATSNAPHLTRLPARYIAHQLRGYRDGARLHDQMQATARMLGEGAGAAARRFSTLPLPEHVPAGDAPDLVHEGDWSRGLPPCASCHAGPERARMAPPLNGQPENYLASELRAYAEARRSTDTMGRMRAFAGRLSESEIDALARWYAQARKETPE
jgi:cytochrome c553